VPISHRRRLETVEKKSANLYIRGQAHIDAERYLEALQCDLKVVKIIPNSWDAGFRCVVLLFELLTVHQMLSGNSMAAGLWDVSSSRTQP
jgi:hypothetical protein